MRPRPPSAQSRKRWQSANVLQLGHEFRKLWGFNSSKRGFVLSQENSIPESDPLPAKLVAKDWKSLFQPRLNIAWLPVDQAFLRVIQLPVGNFDETLQMVEFQLEKLSPLPVTQICWSIHIFPHHVENLQTIIITIVGRDLVQEYLGRLEGQGFLADRLEFPMVDQLQATPITGDGAWIYPGPDSGKFIALVAWWYGGVLRNLALLHVPAVDSRNALFQEQINQMTWAGELEGWLAGSPQWHLVADEATAANWLPLFQAATGQSPEVIRPLVDSDPGRAHRQPRCAGQSQVQYPARRVFHAVSPAIRGQPVDARRRLRHHWLSGRRDDLYGHRQRAETCAPTGVERDMRNLSGQYTNVLKLKAKVQILEDRQALKNAALDSWKITAELLPEGVTIQSLELKNGKSFSLFGNAPRDAVGAVNDFNDAMRKATLGSRPFFSKMETALTHVSGNNRVA